jgi:hypothetical protein
MRPPDSIWIFARANERLELHRVKTDEGFFVIEKRHGLPERSFFFADLSGLIRFETKLTSLLQESGWLLHDFRPERRSGVERRVENRTAGERRRRPVRREYRVTFTRSVRSDVTDKP